LGVVIIKAKVIISFRALSEANYVLRSQLQSTNVARSVLSCEKGNMNCELNIETFNNFLIDYSLVDLCNYNIIILEPLSCSN